MSTKPYKNNGQFRGNGGTSSDRPRGNQKKVTFHREALLDAEPLKQTPKAIDLARARAENPHGLRFLLGRLMPSGPALRLAASPKLGDLPGTNKPCRCMPAEGKTRGTVGAMSSILSSVPQHAADQPCPQGRPVAPKVSTILIRGSRV
jgi:hypothetical protein